MLNKKTNMKGKVLTLQSVASEGSHNSKEENANECLVEPLALLTKQFTKTVKRLNKMPCQL